MFIVADLVLLSVMLLLSWLFNSRGVVAGLLFWLWCLWCWWLAGVLGVVVHWRPPSC